MVQGYCVRCKEKKDMKDAEVTQTAKGGYMAKGKCSSCDTKMCAMMSKETADNAIKGGVRKAF